MSSKLFMQGTTRLSQSAKFLKATNVGIMLPKSVANVSTGTRHSLETRRSEYRCACEVNMFPVKPVRQSIPLHNPREVPKCFCRTLVLLATLVPCSLAQSVPPPPQGTLALFNRSSSEPSLPLMVEWKWPIGSVQADTAQISSMTKNYLEAAVEIAQEAGKILIEELSRPLDIAYKGDEVDLVTQADKRSERFIVERLTKYFPDHAIAAEEGTGHESASASEYRWHVDPLDGTTNFAHGYPFFCVSIALAQRDTLLAAAVFNPFYNELFTAARGEGATFNGKKIHVSKVATLSTSLLCTGFPVRNRKASPNLQYYGDFTQHSHGVRRDGSAALDLAAVAAGRFDAFWEFNLQKWDTAAGVLLVEEAGGKVSDFAGNPYQLGGPVILATNGLIHEEMRAMALEISRRSPAPLRT